MRSACSKGSRWATTMTTSSDGLSRGGGPETVEAATNASKGIVPGMNQTGILAGIDAGIIDRIASSVFGAMVGGTVPATTPGTAIMSPPVPEAIPAAMAPGTMVPI